MKVTFQFEAQLRQVAGSAEQVTELDSGANLLDGLQKITSNGRDDLKARLFSNNGTLQPTILLFLNDQPVPPNQADSTALFDGCTVLLLPPISGG